MVTKLVSNHVTPYLSRTDQSEDVILILVFCLLLILYALPHPTPNLSDDFCLEVNSDS